jgi:serine/threonine protein kinase
LLIN